ncbi:MAG: ADP-ribosylglycohydrolase family protein [Armatimonadetes bacterium]|nr:ADP-ribosylglycohydrolase family protein [Armatimonadota bacterium]
MPENLEQRIFGCLIGTAVGDALGLPTEGLSRLRQRRLFGEIDGHRLFFRRGMVSDDTEHTLMVAAAILDSGPGVTGFQRRLARRLRLWLLSVPAGIGKATLGAGLKLWLGASPDSSGIRSAGNGPAMRSALLGVCFGDNLPLLKKLVRESTRVTHTDPRAYHGALAVVLAAGISAGVLSGEGGPPGYAGRLRGLLEGEDAGELLTLVDSVVQSVERGESTEAFAERVGWGRGVGGYVLQTVPAALHAWMSHPVDYAEAVSAVIRCGGDTDTTAAIVGGIVGAGVGDDGIPPEWIEGLWDSCGFVRRMEGVGRSVAQALEGEAASSPPALSLRLYLDHLLFLTVVLYHGFRRLLPPYG